MKGPALERHGSDADSRAAPPQDQTVDRRAFLKRLSALGLGALSGLAPPISLRGAPPTGLPGGPTFTGEERFFDLESTLHAPFQIAAPADLTVREAGALLRSRELTPSELLVDCLARIRRWDPIYMAFNTIPEEEALVRAGELDLLEPTGLLHGIPLAVKDNFHTRGIRTTANSWIFDQFVPELDATAVSRLIDAGALVLGKTQMGPLATTRALTPDGRVTTVNAWAPLDAEVSPGGSSSGSATAVASRMAPAAIGTQTGGSITSPALAQGLTGLKPTLGRVSLRGVIPLSYTRDHPGPLARDARDAALLMQAMAGPDPLDPRTLGLPPVPDYLTAAMPAERGGRPTLRWPTRVGVPQDWLGSGREEVRADRETFLAALRELGADLVELPTPPGWDELTSPALNAVRLPERSEIFLDELRRDVRLFGVALSPWINGLLLSGNETLRGQRARVALLEIVLEEIFSRCDLALQTSSNPFDMVGLPLISFPIGMRERSGATLPHGVLLGGPPLGEERLLSLATAWQSVTEWHRMRPESLEVFQEARRPAADGGSRGRLGVEEVADLSE